MNDTLMHASVSDIYGGVCVLHIKPFVRPVDIQYTLCPCRFFILESYKFCDHKITTQRYYIVVQQVE